MRILPLIRVTIAVVFCMSLFSCSRMLSPEKSIARTHPEKLTQGRPVCSECHEGNLPSAMKSYARFNHTELFAKDHKGVASREEALCAVCHAESFCSDCHTNRRELKPSLILGDRPDRELVHRGDFLTLHRIEGKIDPVSCYRCHGRTNNGICQSCHR